MFGMGRRFGRGCSRRIPLGECEAGQGGTVVANTGIRAMEMGFFPGVSVQVLSNQSADVSLVVLAGDTRFVVPRDVAQTVTIRRGGKREGHHGRYGGRCSQRDNPGGSVC